MPPLLRSQVGTERVGLLVGRARPSADRRTEFS